MTVFGGSSWENLHSIDTCSDGGYVASGCTYGFGGGQTIVVKLDSVGNIIRLKGIMGSSCFANCNEQKILQTSDDDYIIVGVDPVSHNFLIGKLGPCTVYDCSNWDLVWWRTFPGLSGDILHSIEETSDGNFIVTGRRESKLFFAKFNSEGNMQWSKEQSDNIGCGFDIKATQDGGFVITGETSSNGKDVFLGKFSSDGNTEWSISIGGASEDFGSSVDVDASGNYYIFGVHQSYGIGSIDQFVAKVSPSGAFLWFRTIGTVRSEPRGYGSILLDGGLVIVGDSYNSDGSCGTRSWEKFCGSVAKLDSDGNIVWSKLIDGSSANHEVVQTKDGGFVIAGCEGATTTWGLNMANGFLVTKYASDGSSCNAKEWSDVQSLPRSVTHQFLAFSSSPTQPITVNSQTCSEYYHTPSVSSGSCSGTVELIECFGIPEFDPEVCSVHGECLSTDYCECKEGYFSQFCNDTRLCNGIQSNDTLVCSGHGICNISSSCVCYEGYFGSDCEHWNCHDVFHDNPQACSGNGNCTSLNNCSCEEFKCGELCYNNSCDGVCNVEMGVVDLCSSHGSCFYPNNCSCERGYYSSSKNFSDCDMYQCYGIEFHNPEVCHHRNGTCSAPDSCTSCLNGHYGPQCDLWKCNGTLYNDSSVCSGVGECMKIDTCLCNDPNERCGTFCSSFVCNGVCDTDSISCSGHGTCDFSQCVCDDRYYGDDCEKKENDKRDKAKDKGHGAVAITGIVLGSVFGSIFLVVLSLCIFVFFISICIIIALCGLIISGGLSIGVLSKLSSHYVSPNMSIEDDEQSSSTDEEGEDSEDTEDTETRRKKKKKKESSSEEEDSASQSSDETEVIQEKRRKKSKISSSEEDTTDEGSTDEESFSSSSYDQEEGEIAFEKEESRNVVQEVQDLFDDQQLGGIIYENLRPEGKGEGESTKEKEKKEKKKKKKKKKKSEEKLKPKEKVASHPQHAEDEKKKKKRVKIPISVRKYAEERGLEIVQNSDDGKMYYVRMNPVTRSIMEVVSLVPSFEKIDNEDEDSTGEDSERRRKKKRKKRR